MEAARQPKQWDLPPVLNFSGTLAQDAKTAADFVEATPDSPAARYRDRQMKEALR